MRGQFGAQPLPQQAGAAPLERIVGQRGIRGQRRVELRQRRAGQVRLRVEPGRARVGQSVVAGRAPSEVATIGSSSQTAST